MSEQRAHRVGEEIKREFSDILRNDFKDPRVAGLVSVTGVQVTRDLRHAKIFVSVFGKEEEQKGTLEILSRAAGFFRTEIGKRIRLRHTPEISVALDTSIAYGAHINQLLKDIVPPGGENGRE